MIQLQYYLRALDTIHKTYSVYAIHIVCPTLQHKHYPNMRFVHIDLYSLNFITTYLLRVLVSYNFYYVRKISRTHNILHASQSVSAVFGSKLLNKFVKTKLFMKYFEKINFAEVLRPWSYLIMCDCYARMQSKSYSLLKFIYSIKQSGTLKNYFHRV